MSLDATLGPVRTPRARSTERPSGTASYAALLKTVKDAGLLGRRTPYYVVTLSVLTVALAAAIVGMFLLGESWLQLLIAGALGLIFTQFAFVAHEASHRQVLASGPANDRLGRFLAAAVVGISYTWWMTKHTRHHANPNTVGKDPDIEVDTISFLEEDAAKSRGLVRMLTRVQGYAFFPLLTLEGFNLVYRSALTLFGPGKIQGRALEITFMVVRTLGWIALLLWLFPIGMAAAFFGVQMAVFGVYMGASFAPNHKGMPVIPAGTKVDFLSKQVLTSRNINGWGMNVFMGGLNYQVEHHLFPSMARPNLAAARDIVREYCRTHNVPYTETTLVNSYVIIVQYLNRVGLAARDPFDCPVHAQFRRR